MSGMDGGNAGALGSGHRQGPRSYRPRAVVERRGGMEGGKGSGKESKPDARIVNPNCSHFVETTGFVLCIPNQD